MSLKTAREITYPQLFENNRQWAADISAQEPGFFQRLAAQQTPEYMWIGCSDSRVPANELLGLLPGELFVHRNIANVVVHSDLNCLSVLQFAVDVLKVKHIIICGHYGCGGVQAAMIGRRVGLADNWLRHVKDVTVKHGRYLGQVLGEKERLDRLCELNAIEQAHNLCQTTVIQDAWGRGQEVTVHSIVYGVHDGLLRDLGVNIGSQQQLEESMATAFNAYE